MSNTLTGRAAQPGLLTTLVPSLAQFLVVADTTIISVAMPSIRAGLHIGVGAQEWVVNAYLLVFGGLLILGGRAGDVFGPARVLLAGLGVLALASLLGGLAGNAGTLIAARAGQGVAAALIAPAPLALIVSSHPDPPGRVRAIAVWNAVAASGLVAGTALGGLLSGTVGWRWVLLVNVPAAAILAVATRFVLPRTRAYGRWRDIRLPAGILLTAGIGALVYAISAAQDRSWSAPAVVGALVMAAVLLTAFGIVESRARDPLITSSLLRLRAFVVGNLGMALSGAIVNTTILFVSLLLQEARGYTALSAAMALLPLAIAIPVTSMQVVRLLRAIGPRAHLFVFATITAIGLVWQAGLNPAGSYLTGVLLPGLVIGVGLGGMGVAITSTAMAVPESDSGTASAVVAASRQIGGCIGVAVASSAAPHIPAAVGGGAAIAHGYATAVLFAGGFAAALALVALLIPRLSTVD